MILLISGLMFALGLFIIPYLWSYGVSLVTKFLAEEPNKDSLFRLLEDKDGNIHIQFSNNSGKTYYDYNDTIYRSESTAKSKLDEIILRMNKTEKSYSNTTLTDYRSLMDLRGNFKRRKKHYERFF